MKLSLGHIHSTKFGGDGTPEAVPLLRDATGQEARAGPEGETSFPYGVKPDSINPSDLTTGQAKILAFCLPRSKLKALLWGPSERLDFKINNSDFRQKMFELCLICTALYALAATRTITFLAPFSFRTLTASLTVAPEV